jgi:hypothetical protein
MRKLFNEIQNAETASKADFNIKQVFYNLLGEVIRFDGEVIIDSQPVPALWNPTGDLISFNDQNPDGDVCEKYQLLIRRRLTGDTKQLEVYWMAATYYMLSGRLRHGSDYKVINGKYLAFKFQEFFGNGFKAYCRKAYIPIGAMYGIHGDIEKQPYTILKNSFIYKSIEAELTGFDLVVDIRLLNLDVDFEALKSSNP